MQHKISVSYIDRIYLGRSDDGDNKNKEYAL